MNMPAENTPAAAEQPRIALDRLIANQTESVLRQRSARRRTAA